MTLMYIVNWEMMRNVTGQKPRYQKPQRIIDMGCGLGFYVKALQERGLECHGFGFSEKRKYTADLVFNWRCLQIVFDDPKRMIPSQKHARILWKDWSRIEVEQINTMIWISWSTHEIPRFDGHPETERLTDGMCFHSDFVCHGMCLTWPWPASWPCRRWN